MISVMINLRNYQAEAIKSVLLYLYQHKKGNPLVVAPTGSGKTHIIAGICQQLEKISSKSKVIIVSHVEEILRQDSSKLRDYIDRKKVGVYSAGIGLKQVRQFTVASIQTVCNCPEKFKDYTHIIVDEAHRIPASGMGQYRKFFDKLPQARVIGLTATPYRLGHGYLTEDHIFDKVVYDIDIIKLIEQGYLSNLVTKEPSYEYDTSQLKTVAGDFSKKDMVGKLNIDNITRQIVDELVLYKSKRKHWVVFAIDISHAENIQKYLQSQGVVCAALHSKMEKQDRIDLISLFKDGHIQCLISVEILTTGFDAPHIDLIVLMRPTKSPVLHVQMIGRGMRICEGKENCLVLDFAGNTKRLGPINDVWVKKKGEKEKKGNGEGLTKTCPKCDEIVHIVVKKCPSCNYDFPIQNKLSLNPDQQTQLLKTKQTLKVKEFVVDKVKYFKHNKTNRPPSLKVVYHCGLRSFNEWVALEHTGYPRLRAESWWKYRTGEEAPDTVTQALTQIGKLPCPKTVTVDFTQQYPEVIKYSFDFKR